MSFDTILFEKQANIATITLNRPRVLNAINVQMRDELWEVFGALRDDTDVDVILVRGAGPRAFCAGADLTEFGTAPPPVEARAVRYERDLWGTIATTRQPMVAALRGYVLGAGLELALLCDLRVAAEGAQLGLPDGALALLPAGLGTQTLARNVAPGLALDLLLRGRSLDASQAWEAGLVNRVVAPARLDAVAGRLASKLAEWDPLALRLAKEAVVQGQDLPLRQALTLGDDLALLLQPAASAPRR